MEGTTIAVLGTAASVLSTISLLPQVLRTWRTRSAGDISALWLTVALASMMLWIGYGVLVGASAVVWANARKAIIHTEYAWPRELDARVAATLGPAPAHATPNDAQNQRTFGHRQGDFK